LFTGERQVIHDEDSDIPVGAGP